LAADEPPPCCTYLLDIPAGIPYIELHKVVGIGFRNNPEEFLFGPGVFSKLTIGRLSEPNKIKAIEKQNINIEKFSNTEENNYFIVLFLLLTQFYFSIRK
jgi:hypothetical protein